MSKALIDNLANIQSQKNTYLVPNNIKNGVQIFDIVGTYTGASSEGVKLFDTVANMQADSTAQLDDLAIVYGDILSPITRDSIFSQVHFNQTIVFDTAVTDSIYVMPRPVDTSQWIQFSIEISPDYINIRLMRSWYIFRYYLEYI